MSSRSESGIAGSDLAFCRVADRATVAVPTFRKVAQILTSSSPKLKKATCPPGGPLRKRNFFRSIMATPRWPSTTISQASWRPGGH